MQKLCFVVTGVPGAGKTTLARSLEKTLVELGKKVVVADGNDFREACRMHGIEFSFNYEGRVANHLTAAGKLLVEALKNDCHYAIMSFLFPYGETMRKPVFMLFKAAGFKVVHIFIDVPNDVAVQRTWARKILCDNHGEDTYAEAKTPVTSVNAHGWARYDIPCLHEGEDYYFRFKHHCSPELMVETLVASMEISKQIVPCMPNLTRGVFKPAADLLDKSAA